MVLSPAIWIMNARCWSATLTWICPVLRTWGKMVNQRELKFLTLLRLVRIMDRYLPLDEIIKRTTKEDERFSISSITSFFRDSDFMASGLSTLLAACPEQPRRLFASLLMLALSLICLLVLRLGDLGSGTMRSLYSRVNLGT